MKILIVDDEADTCNFVQNFFEERGCKVFSAMNGFHGLGGLYGRNGLMDFSSDPSGAFAFQRTDSGDSVSVVYDPSCIPPVPEMMPLLQRILQGDNAPANLQHFREMWLKRVIDILDDGGERTVTVARK